MNVPLQATHEVSWMLHEGMSEWYRIDGGGSYNLGIAFGMALW